MFLLLNPVWNIVNSFSEMQRSLAAMERCSRCWRWKTTTGPTDAVDAPALVRELRFDGVTFEYRDGQPVVPRFQRLRARRIRRCIGWTERGGKTTVTDLVARFHDPTHGRLQLNGTDIRDLKLRSYRDLLAIVQQDVFLFDGRCATTSPTAATMRPTPRSRMRRSAPSTRVHRPPATRLRDVDRRARGEAVAASQQRLAIARAILASPQILILDEATSNLDTEASS